MLGASRPLPETLRNIYQPMIDLFLIGEHGARGCYLVGTAATEAVQNPQVREMLARSLKELDEAFVAAFSAAQARGELGKRADPRALATVVSAVVHTLALRARSGQSRAVLRAVADSAVKLLCSAGPAARKRKRR